MRIVLDLQGELRDEGRAGSDAVSFALAIVRNRGEHEVLLALNGLFPETIEYIRVLFGGLLPRENIRVWHVLGPVSARDAANTWRREVAEHIREAFFVSLRADIVHVSSLFEGYDNDVVTSIGVFAPQIQTCVMLDGVPLPINPERVPALESHFTRKLEHLGRASCYMSISADSSNALLSTPGFDSRRVEYLDVECSNINLQEPGLEQDGGLLWDGRAKRALEIYENMRASHGQSDNFEDRDALFSRLIEVIAAAGGKGWHEDDLLKISRAIASSFPGSRGRQLFVDVSAISQVDCKTGIQRVTRSILKELLNNPPDGYKVEPVYATPHSQGFFYARQYAAQLLDQVCEGLDEAIEYSPGDLFLGLDLQHGTLIAQHDYLKGMWRDGVKIIFVIYDLLPILKPRFFALEAGIHKKWLEIVTGFDGAMCISRAVADELMDWLEENNPPRAYPLSVNYFHLGADIKNSLPTLGFTAGAEDVLERIRRAPTFLMVGTVEPRKGHQQTLNAFELLWSRGFDVNLVIVGNPGWKVEELIERLRFHPELGRHLFWPMGISDEYLEEVYAASACLVSSSEGEGFGLPLIEAARHSLPILARDIPVFREVAGDQALYFSGLHPDELAAAVENWLALSDEGKIPPSSGIKWLTWAESSEQLKNRIDGRSAYKQWFPKRRGAEYVSTFR